VQEQKVFS